jgi:hypothetical protein
MMMDDGQMGTTTKVTWMGKTNRSVSDVIAGDQEHRQGNLANGIKAFVDGQAGAVDAKQIMAEFPQEKQGTIYANLKRLRERGLIHQPAYGIYQSMKHAPKNEQ